MASKTSAEDERFDTVLLNLAQQITAAKGPGLDPLLESFFGFLRRRTDFYTGADDDKVLDKIQVRGLSRWRLTRALVPGAR